MAEKSTDNVIALREGGFVFQAGEIYGGSCPHGTTAPSVQS